MKGTIFSLIIIIILTACSSAPTTMPASAVDTAVAQTLTSAPTQTALPTNTPEPTNTEVPTNTPSPTDTPIPAQIAGAECIPEGTERTEAVVTRVIDGDTIDVDIGGQVSRVRYIGMDTPESTTETEYFGQEATAFNTQLVDGKTITLIKDVSETDQFGRLLRYVIVGDFFVNYELVRQGFANTTTFPPDVACESVYLEAEGLAREEGRGFWAPTPTPEATETPLPTNTPRPQPTATAAPVVQPTAPQENCDPSYPDVCIPPPPPDLDCGDIPYRRFRVVGSDPHRFDGDHDGIGCES